MGPGQRLGGGIAAPCGDIEQWTHKIHASVTHTEQRQLAQRTAIAPARRRAQKS
jgi:hypothetical protein